MGGTVSPGVHMSRTTAGLAILFPLVLSAAASCGGGGGGIAISTPRSDEVLLPVVTGSGDVELFDPSSPATAPLAEDSGVDAAFLCDSGAGSFRFDAATLTGDSNGLFTSSNDAYENVVYINGGKLWRIDLVRGHNHAPVQFSDITNACSIPGNQVGDTLAGGVFRVLVNTKGPDNTCATSDDVRRIVNITAPTSATTGHSADRSFKMRRRVRSTTGKVVGVVAEETPSGTYQLSHYDMADDGTLGNQHVLGSIKAGTEVLGQAFPTRTVTLFRMEAAADTAFKLFNFDASNNSFNPVYTYTGTASGGGPIATEVGVNDASFVYLGDGQALKKMAFDGSSQSTLKTLSSGLVVAELFLVNNRIVVHVTTDPAGGAEQLFSIPTTGGSTTALDSTATATYQIVDVFGGLVYFNVTAGGVTTAKLIGADGTGGATFGTGSMWGAIAATNTTGGGAGKFQAGSDISSSEIDVLLLAQQSGSNVIVKAVDGPTGAVGNTLGTIVNGTVSTAAPFNGFNYGSTLVLTSPINRGGPVDFDAYFADVDSAGSVRAWSAVSGAEDCAM